MGEVRGLAEVSDVSDAKLLNTVHEVKDVISSHGNVESVWVIQQYYRCSYYGLIWSMPQGFHIHL